MTASVAAGRTGLTSRAFACLLLALLFVGTVVAQTPAEQLQQLRRELQQAEDLTASVEAPERLRVLNKLQPPPGSSEALEQLYLLATTQGTPPIPEQRWDQWRQAADPSQIPLLERVRALVRAERAWQLQRYRETLDMLPPQTQAELPPAWRLRELMLRADALEENGDPQGALLLRLRAQELLDNLATPARQAYALSILANTYGRIGESARGLEAAQESLSRIGDGGSAALRARLYNGLALAYTNQGRRREGREALEQALQFARQAGDQRFLATVLGNISDAYLRAEAWAKALKAAEEAYQLALKQPGTSAQSLALHNRGIAKIHLGRQAEGNADVRSSVGLELQMGGKTYAAEGLLELGAALEKTGDLAGALKAYHEYRELADAQVRTDLRDALRQAQAKVEAQRLALEKRALQQQNVADAARVESQKLGLLLGLLGIACGIALLALLVLLYRRLRRTNALLADTNRDLAAKTEVDPLTGLGNRRRIERLLRKHSEGGVLRGGLLLLDIDHFKQINDQHGHAAGDVVLQAVAGRLRAALREGEAEGVVRWGGEEFLLLLPAADGALVAALAQRLLVDLAETPVSLRDGVQLRVSASIGAAAFPEAAPQADCNGERAIAVVDALMYLAKLRGRHQAWQLIGSDAAGADALLAQLQDAEAASTAGGLRLRRHGGPREAGA